MNTVIVVVDACVLNIIVGRMAGYGFAKKKFKGRELIFPYCFLH
jgi:ABC-type glycerol-3-phosphate transport system permease component